MTCQELSDRMPAVAAGAATWSPEEVEHLRTCADCRTEWTVVNAGRGVGADTRVDADALAARVLHRLRTEPIVGRSQPRRWLFGLAAAAVVVFILMPRPSTAPLPRSSAALPLAVDVPGLDGLASGELADVLESLETSWTETSTSDAPSLEDLDPRELERMERSWEI